jgi:hypothetical protein
MLSGYIYAYMNNDNLITKGFIIWEEKNLIEPVKKLESSGEIKQADIISNIEIKYEKIECEDTGKKKKRCTKCKDEKELSDFYKDLKSKDGLNWYCIECENLRNKKYHAKNKEIRKIQMIKYYNKNKIRLKSYNQKRMKIYRQKSENKLARKKWYEYQRKNNIRFRIECILRGRFSRAIRKRYKYTSVINLVGCSMEELRNHLESKFNGSMSWNNQGKWHIDHIRPCSSFDLTNLEEQKKCFHYTNLQPLWAIDNLKKGNKIL